MKTQKKKGSQFERDLVKFLLREVGGDWKRIPGSGAFSKTSDIKTLVGDVIGTIGDDLKEFSFVIEAKHGYGGSKQITVKREWFDSAREYAEEYFRATGISLIPIVWAKPNYSKISNSIVMMEAKEFVKLLNLIVQLYQEMINLESDMAGDSW